MSPMIPTDEIVVVQRSAEAQSPPPPQQQGQGQGQQPAKDGQHCFKNAGGTEICVQKTAEHHNSTDVFEQNGVNDRHNEFSNKNEGNVAGNVPSTNISAVMHGDEDAKKDAPGSTVFQGHNIDSNEGFRDTHSSDGRNGTSPVYEDHKEGTDRNGHEYEAHGAKPDGTLTNAEGHVLTDNKYLVDVHDADGVTDTTQQDSSDSDFLRAFHQHHAGDKSRQGDSSVLTHVNVDQDHVKEEHKGDDFLVFHEASDNKGSLAFKLNGNDAWKDMQEQAKNMPGDVTKMHPRSVADDALTKAVLTGGKALSQIEKDALMFKSLGASPLVAATSADFWQKIGKCVRKGDWSACYQTAEAAERRFMRAFEAMYVASLVGAAEKKGCKVGSEIAGFIDQASCDAKVDGLRSLQLPYEKDILQYLDNYADELAALQPSSGAKSFLPWANERIRKFGYPGDFVEQVAHAVADKQAAASHKDFSANVPHFLNDPLPHIFKRELVDEDAFNTVSHDVIEQTKLMTEMGMWQRKFPSELPKAVQPGGVNQPVSMPIWLAVLSLGCLSIVLSGVLSVLSMKACNKIVRVWKGKPRCVLPDFSVAIEVEETAKYEPLVKTDL